MKRRTVQHDGKKIRTGSAKPVPRTKKARNGK